MQQLLFDNSGAKFSECRKYRYCLWRIWDETKPFIQFIGLNPSTGNENANDNTLRRVIRFAKDWGYGGIFMTNLFGLVSSKPEALLSHVDPVGENDKYLKEIANVCKGEVLFAWGAFKQAKQRAIDVSAMFTTAKALALNADGSPIHPLFVPANTKPIIYK